MKNLVYILFILLSACRFDPGSTPKNQKKTDLIDATPVQRDMARDTKKTDRDTSKSDLGKNLDLSHRDTSSDMVKDVAADIVADAKVDMNPVGSMCDGQPVDLKTNLDNCGSCDNACDANFATCEEGNCTCPENAEPCGPNNTCQDTKSDPLNCGGCGRTCGLAAECINSACVCLNGYRDCNGKCTNLDADPLNCGQCRNVCSGEESSCNNGSCERSCFGAGWSCDLPNGVTSCAKRSDVYTCNSKGTDRCGTECGVGETCQRNGGLSVTYRCRTNRPTIACQTCPCAECTGDEDCVVSNFAGNEIFCVEK